MCGVQQVSTSAKLFKGVHFVHLHRPVKTTSTRIASLNRYQTSFISVLTIFVMNRYGEEFKACARCKHWRPTRYCSAAHQKKHWRTHKHECFAHLALELATTNIPALADDDDGGDGGAELDADGDISGVAVLPDEILEHIFAALVDAGTVSELPKLKLVCKKWCVVASKPTLWRFVRFVGGSSIQESSGVAASTEPSMQSMFRQLACGNRSQHLLKVEFGFMYVSAPRRGVGGVRGPFFITLTCGQY